MVGDDRYGVEQAQRCGPPQSEEVQAQNPRAQHHAGQPIEAMSREQKVCERHGKGEDEVDASPDGEFEPGFHRFRRPSVVVVQLRLGDRTPPSDWGGDLRFTRSVRTADLTLKGSG